MRMHKEDGDCTFPRGLPSAPFDALAHKRKNNKTTAFVTITTTATIKPMFHALVKQETRIYKIIYFLFNKYKIVLNT